MISRENGEILLVVFETNVQILHMHGAFMSYMMGQSPAYEPCSGPMVQHYCHGATIALGRDFNSQVLKRNSINRCRFGDEGLKKMSNLTQDSHALVSFD